MKKEKYEFWMGKGSASTFLSSDYKSRKIAEDDGEKLICVFEANNVDDAFKKHNELYEEEITKRKPTKGNRKRINRKNS